MATENSLRSREVSAMIKQGFISDQPFTFSPSRSTSKSHSPHSSPSKTLASPPPPPFSKSPSPPPQPTNSHGQTLYEMMSEDQGRDSRITDTARRKLHERVARLVDAAPFRSPGWEGGAGDVRLAVVAKDGFRVSMDVHKSVLSSKSRFFADKLRRERGVSHTVEISDCDDLEVYVETVVLMYHDDLKKRLIGEEVSKVLGLLKVSAAIMFDDGIDSCLEYLEAVPWSEDEEEKVISNLNQLQLDDHPGSEEVLSRVSSEPSTSSRPDENLARLLAGVLQAKDDKARREMKSLVSHLLREDSAADDNTATAAARLDVSKETLYRLCHKCIGALVSSLREAAGAEEEGGGGGGGGRRDRAALMGEIAREADNVQWIVDILVEKKSADEFVKIWADQGELARLHSRIPTVYRHEISRVTAQLCVAIGRGRVLVPKETRFSLLSTWLEALYDDFGWMRRACRSVDKKVVEDGLGQTILTLPLAQQQTILLNWFDRFLNKGDDCPNVQRAFEVWWRRAFVRECVAEQGNSQLQIMVYDYQN